MTVISKYKTLPVSFLTILSVTCVVSVFFVLKSLINHLINQYNYDFSWGLTSAKIFSNYVFWAILSPVIYSLVKSVQKRNVNFILHIPKIILGIVALAIIHSILSARFDDLINYLNSGYLKAFFGRNSITVLVVESFTSLIELLVIAMIFFGLDYQKKYLIKQKELFSAQLSALRMQLHPHFLFNTLHSIASMIDIDSKNAQKMISKLGTLLRKVLEYDAEQLVTVTEELSFVRDYLDLEQVRYQDRLTINYKITDLVLEMKLPNMILQPLIENAVKHGAAKVIDDGNIDIHIVKEFSSVLNEDMLTIKISNTTNPNNNTNTKGTGVGLKNVRERLQAFYEDRFNFYAESLCKDRYMIKIEIPISR